MLTRVRKQGNDFLKDEEKMNQDRLMALNTLFEAARAGKAGEDMALMSHEIQNRIPGPADIRKKAGQSHKP